MFLTDLHLGGSMLGILWFVILAIACVWAVSLVAVGGLALLAHRGDPRVIVDDPWDTLPTQRRFEQLRADAARARDMRTADDFARWQEEIRGQRPRPDAPAHRRPPPAA